jgi:hypothetical protein
MFKQSFIPGFPDGAQRIGEWLSILEHDGKVTYFVGGDNYFSHPLGDVKSRRFALASLMDNGHVRAVDLEGPPLLIAHRTLMNWTAQFRTEGSTSFFRNVATVRPTVMDEETSAQCARLLAEGVRPSVVVLRPTLIWTRRPTPVEADRRLVSRSVLGGAGSWRKVRHERGAKAAKNGTMNNAAGVDVGGVCGQRWAGFRTAGRPAPSCWRSR